MSRATRDAASFTEASSGVAAVKHDPTIDPNVRRYPLDLFNLNSMSSQCSNCRSTLVETFSAASEESSQNNVNFEAYQKTNLDDMESIKIQVYVSPLLQVTD